MTALAPPRPALPPGLRLLNHLAAGLGPRLHPLDPGHLIAEAIRHEGSDDLGEPGFLPLLELLCRSLEEDAGLHFLGRRHMHTLLVGALRSRIRLARARREQPAVFAAPLRPPLLVCGLPRTGTTFLHRLLAEAEDARALLLWELMEPIPPPGPDRRLQEARRRIARMRRLAPLDMDSQHLVRAELPDECSHLMKPAFLSAMYAMAPVACYLEEYPHHDARPAYRDYRDLLAFLSAGDGRRLVLKDPFHALFLPALFEAIPDAMVVQTHREPAEVVPSFHKLTCTMQSILSTRTDSTRAVEANMRWLETLATRSLESRVQIPARQVLDIDYRALVADPVKTVERIHRHFDLPWTTALQEHLGRLVEEEARRGRPANPYTPEQFGLDAEAINSRFAAYRAGFPLA